MKISILQRVIIGIIILHCISACAADEKAEGTTLDSVEQSLNEINESYGEYADIAGNGISKHLVRSHTTSMLLHPLSSTYELCNRVWDEAWDMGRRAEVRFIRFPILRHSEIPRLPRNPDGMDLKAWEKHLGLITGSEMTSARIGWLIDGEAFYSSLEKAIDQAHNSIDLQTYLFDNDDVARAIADRLRARSDEVDVRVMYDGLGTYLSHLATAETQPANCVLIHNLPSYLCRNSAIKLKVLPNTWMSGNHVKCMIFDDRLAFVGGMNLGREYRYEWHDMMVRLEGAAVKQLENDFQTTWRLHGLAGDLAPFIPGSAGSSHGVRLSDEVPVRWLRTLPANAQIYRAQLAAIRRAQAYIYIENAYFADDRIIYELCRARRRGVDVRVIMPSEVNHTIMEHSNRIAIDTLLQNGVSVYMYPGMSHVKAAVYDGWACLGTANFDKLSLQINRELNLATSHPATVQQLLDVLFEPDFKKSTKLNKPVALKFRDHVIELIADEA